MAPAYLHALYPRIFSRRTISRRGICSSVALITAEAPKNPQKNALREILLERDPQK
jgi:hypothetical protein